jgi:hypothetical protein
MECPIERLTHSFFYTVGVATTASILYYIWSDNYADTASRLMTDAGWIYCRLETKVTRLGQKLSNAISPVIRLVSPAEVPNKNIKFYNTNKDVVKEMGLIEFRQLDENWNVEYCYGVYSIKNDDDQSMTRLFNTHTGIDLDDMKFSSAYLLSAVLKEEGKDDVDLIVSSPSFRSAFVVGNELFTEEFMRHVFDMSLPNKYTIEVIDNNVNQHKIEKYGFMRVEVDNLDIYNHTSRDSSFEEVEVNKNPSLLFGWMSKKTYLQSKKHD